MQLTVNEAAYGGLTHVVILDYLDLIAIGTGNQKTLVTLKAGSAVELCVVHKITAAAGSTSVVFDVGTTGADPDDYIDNLDADGMTAPVFNTGDKFTAGTGTAGTGLSQAIGSTATDVPVLLEVNDASLASLTAGKWLIGFRILNLARFA